MEVELRSPPRQKTPEQRARIAERARLRYAADPARGAAAQARYRERNPEKCRARLWVTNEIAAGRLIRPETCPQCGGDGPIHAHHPSYDKPDVIEWGCRPCHFAHHSGMQSERAGKPNVHHRNLRREVAA